MFRETVVCVLALMLLCGCNAKPQSQPHSQPRIRSIEVYGSAQLTNREVLEVVGDDIEELGTLYDERDSNDYSRNKEAIESTIEALGDFAFVAVTMIESYTSDHPIDVTIDLVDAGDQLTRMNFLPTPVGESQDPAGLLAAWSDYEELSSDLFRTDKLPSIRANAFHSLWGFDHEELAPFERRFDVEVERHKAKLTQVLRESPIARERAHAAFLLAHLHDVEELINTLVPQIYDPSSLVRNNVMRVLASVARNNDSVPIGPVIDAIRFPTATDRNKALAILRFQVTTSEAKRRVIGEVGEELLAMLKLQTPANHNLSYVVLQRLSGEEFAARDHDAWESWLRLARTEILLDMGIE